MLSSLVEFSGVGQSILFDEVALQMKRRSVYVLEEDFIKWTEL